MIFNTLQDLIDYTDCLICRKPLRVFCNYYGVQKGFLNFKNGKYENTKYKNHANENIQIDPLTNDVNFVIPSNVFRDHFAIVLQCKTCKFVASFNSKINNSKIEPFSLHYLEMMFHDKEHKRIHINYYQAVDKTKYSIYCNNNYVISDFLDFSSKKYKSHKEFYSAIKLFLFFQ